MLSQLKQQWKQSPVLFVTVLVLLLITFLLSFFIILGNTIKPAITQKSHSDSTLGLIPTEQSLYDFASRTVSNERPPVPNQVPQKKVGQKIIKTASLSFQVKDYQKSRSLIENIVKSNNGYLASENQQNGTDRIENTIVIRVPAENLDRLIEALQGQSVYLDHKSIEARDVTEEFVDTEARLKAKREVEQRYLTILKQAASVKDILEVESHLGSIREDIEATEGRLRYLNDQIALSTITLYIYQPVHRLPLTESGFWGKLSKAVINGWNGLLGFVIGLISLWPFLLIAYGSWVGYRYWQKRKGKGQV